MRVCKITFLFLLLGFSVFAEVRLWKDTAGNEYQAEYVRELFDKITLKTTDGEEVRVAVKDLSEHDQKYLRVMVPPNLSIDFSKETSIKDKPKELWDTDDDTILIIRGTVVVKKESKRPFTSGLKAELFLIADEINGNGNFVLLSKTDSSFLLGDHNDNTHSFRADPVETQRYLEYNGIERRGEEYKGYLIVISDAKGNIIQTKTKIRGWIDAPEVIENLRKLAAVGAPTIRSRHFDKTGSKVKVPRPKFYSPGNY